MDISIITPSYNMLAYLKCCVASIADQQGVECEHIVVDGKSTDGTVEWLSSQSGIRYISEPDNGMYDAINKGLKSANGEILAYLNCDEQYLPGTLEKVNKYFSSYPQVDLLFGSVLVTDNNGDLLAYRKAYRPSYAYITTSILYNLSCSMFFRRKLLNEGFFFDDRLKNVADADFVLRLLSSNHRAAYISEYLSIFTWNGNNMSSGENARKEKEILINRYGKKGMLIRVFYNISRYFEKFISGAYCQKWPINYSIYINGTSERKNFTVERGTYKWPSI
ncbi:MAG: glycosyltransferase [Bacteroidetes bacterium]|nr:glycosyltransferase [Bacteroidota bacterium]